MRGAAAAQFRSSDVFENAARFFAQNQADVAMELLQKEADTCESAIGYAKHQVRVSQERAATAYLEIGSILREQGKGADAVDAFLAMLRVNPEDTDALHMLAVQCGDLKRHEDAERWFNTLLHYVGRDGAAAANVKRDLSLVFLSSQDFARAESTLEEVMEIERSRRSQRGEAVTHELIGTVRMERKHWTLARRAYAASKSIFDALGDAESTDRLEKRVRAMEAMRDEELRRRRERRHAGRRHMAGIAAEVQTVH